MDYPSNSFKSKEQTKLPAAPKQASIVQSKVSTKAPSRSFFKEFFSKDLSEIKDYIIFDVLLPKTKDVLFDLIDNGASMLIFGDGRGRNRKTGSNGTYISYNTISSNGRKTHETASTRRSDDMLQDVIFENIADAESVLDAMIEILDHYDMVTVGALYELCDIETSSRDFNYGWKNLSSARTRRTRDGYILDLPRPIAID